jgi:hypothetical protein
MGYFVSDYRANTSQINDGDTTLALLFHYLFLELGVFVLFFGKIDGDVVQLASD